MESRGGERDGEDGVTSSAMNKTNEVNVCHMLQVTYVTLSRGVDSCFLCVYIPCR